MAEISAIVAELQVAVDAAVLAACEKVVASAQARVPVATGRLRDAIHIDVQPEGIYIVAGDNEAFYGHMVEHGTVNVPPRPFLVPALEENREAIVEAASLAVRRVVGH